MKRRHAINFTFFFRAFVVAGLFILCIALLGYAGLANWSTKENMREALLFSSIYILLMLLVIPLVYGRVNWKKYMFPGIYKYLNKNSIRDNLNKENFISPVVEYEKTFYESEHWFSFDGILVAKNLIEEIKVENRGSYKSYTLGYRILLSTGQTICLNNIEVASRYSKYHSQPITMYITEFYRSRMDCKHKGAIMPTCSLDEESLWSLICSDSE